MKVKCGYILSLIENDSQSHMFIPLSQLKSTQSLVIRQFMVAKSIKRKLMDMGLLPSREFTVKAKFSDGRVVIGNCHFKIALDAKLASQILVSEIK